MTDTPSQKAATKVKKHLTTASEEDINTVSNILQIVDENTTLSNGSTALTHANEDYFVFGAFDKFASIDTSFVNALSNLKNIRDIVIKESMVDVSAYYEHSTELKHINDFSPLDKEQRKPLQYTLRMPTVDDANARDKLTDIIDVVCNMNPKVHKIGTSLETLCDKDKPVCHVLTFSNMPHFSATLFHYLRKEFSPFFVHAKVFFPTGKHESPTLCVYVKEESMDYSTAHTVAKNHAAPVVARKRKRDDD